MFNKNKKGASAIEYGLISALIIISAIAILSLTGSNINLVFNYINKSISNTVAKNPFVQGCIYNGSSPVPGNGCIKSTATITSKYTSGSSFENYYVNGSVYEQVGTNSGVATINNTIFFQNGWVDKNSGGLSKSACETGSYKSEVGYSSYYHENNYGIGDLNYVGPGKATILPGGLIECTGMSKGLSSPFYGGSWSQYGVK